MKQEYKITCSRVTFNRYIQTNEELGTLFKKIIHQILQLGLKQIKVNKFNFN